jgi:hypothetical protein
MGVFPASLFCPGIARIEVKSDCSPRTRSCRHATPDSLKLLRNAYANRLGGALGRPRRLGDTTLPDPGHGVVNLIEIVAAGQPS